MKIGIQTWGSNGDIFPFLSLAGGLRSKGHDVELVVSSVDRKDYSHYARSLDIALSQTSVERLHSRGSAEFLEIIDQVKNPLKQMNTIINRWFEPLVDEMYSAADQLCQKNDVIIGHFLHHPLRAAADAWKKPYITVALVHSGVSSRHAPPAGLPNLGKNANLGFWKIGEFLLHKYFTPSINKFRTNKGLTPVKSYRDVWCSEHLNILAVSAIFCQSYPDWEPWHRICGFLNPPFAGDCRVVPEDLQNFIRAGEPPVFISFGSMLSLRMDAHHIKRILLMLQDAVHKAGCRAIIQADWNEVEDAEETPLVFRTGAVPHELIFGDCSLVVHHGSAGMSHSATRAGVPSVVVAHMGDQLFWGNELKALGIAPVPLNIKSVNADKISAAIRSVLNNPAMKTKAGELGRRIREENGVSSAVASIEEYFR